MFEDLQSDKFLTRTLFNNFGKVLVFVFYSQWNQQSLKLKDNIIELIPLFGQFQNVKYFTISLEKCGEIAKKYSVQYTPTVILTQTDKKVIKKFEIDDAGVIFDAISEQSENQAKNFETEKKIWHPKIKSILGQSAVIAFIKGSPQSPKCGFTETLVNILKNQGIQFTYYDILTDEYMRYWLRNYSGWATYPQIYSNGKLIGGLDVVKDLIAKGEFLSLIPETSRLVSQEVKFSRLIKENRVMLFGDGFSFENKQIQSLIARLSNKFNKEEIMMVNVGLEEKMRNYIVGRGYKLPVVFVDGEIYLE